MILDSKWQLITWTEILTAFRGTLHFFFFKFGLPYVDGTHYLLAVINCCVFQFRDLWRWGFLIQHLLVMTDTC